MGVAATASRLLVSYGHASSFFGPLLAAVVALQILSQARKSSSDSLNCDLHARASAAAALHHTPRAPLVTVCAPLLNPPRNVAHALHQWHVRTKPLAVL